MEKVSRNSIPPSQGTTEAPGTQIFPIDKLTQISNEYHLPFSFYALLSGSYDGILSAFRNLKDLPLSDVIKSLDVLFVENTSESALSTFRIAMDYLHMSIEKQKRLTGSRVDPETLSHIFGVIKTNIVPRVKLWGTYYNYTEGLANIWNSAECQPYVIDLVKDMVVSNSVHEYRAGLDVLIHNRIHIPAVLSVFHHFVEHKTDRMGTFFLDEFLECLRIKFSLNQGYSRMMRYDMSSFIHDLQQIYPTVKEHGHQHFLQRALYVLSAYVSPEVGQAIPLDQEDRNNLSTFMQTKYRMNHKKTESEIRKYTIVPRVVELLRILTSSEDANDLIFSKEENLADTFDSKKSKLRHLPGLLAYLGDILIEPEKFTFQIGVLLSCIPIYKLPLEVRQKIETVETQFQMKVEVGHDAWNLCDSAEPKLWESLHNNAFVVVNDHMLVKMDGRLCGLCVQTFTNSDGETFYEGNWYAPTDTSSRDKIRHAYDKGQSRVQLGVSEWALLRSFSASKGKTLSEEISEVNVVLKGIPDQLPLLINDIPRYQYRLEKFENYI